VLTRLAWLTWWLSSPGLVDDISSFAMASASVAVQRSGILRFGSSIPVLSVSCTRRTAPRHNSRETRSKRHRAW
jgi:hypothetical protein